MKILFILTSAIFLLGCQTGKNNSTSTTYDDSIDFAEVVIDTSVMVCFSNLGHPHLLMDPTVCKLNYSELQTIEQLLNNCVDEFNLSEAEELKESNTVYAKRQLRKEHYKIDVKDYKRQYRVGNNDDGDKTVNIKFYCNPVQFDWKNEHVVIKDGGKCYFQAYFNLTQNTCDGLYVNGVG